MHRRPPRTPCVLLSLCQGCSACQTVPAQEAVSFGMPSLATAKCFRGRYVIPALGELFLTDLKVLLDPCGMKLLSHVCKGSWGALGAGCLHNAWATCWQAYKRCSCRLLCHQPHPKLHCLPRSMNAPQRYLDFVSEGASLDIPFAVFPLKLDSVCF